MSGYERLCFFAEVRQSDRVPEFRSSFFLRGEIMNYWLMKSEPGVFGIDDLAAAPGKTAPWWGVRNYQARNFMRDQMLVGDRVFFYHSSCADPATAGLARVSELAYP